MRFCKTFKIHEFNLFVGGSDIKISKWKLLWFNWTIYGSKWVDTLTLAQIVNDPLWLGKLVNVRNNVYFVGLKHAQINSKDLWLYTPVWPLLSSLLWMIVCPTPWGVRGLCPGPTEEDWTHTEVRTAESLPFFCCRLKTHLCTVTLDMLLAVCLGGMLFF